MPLMRSKSQQFNPYTPIRQTGQAHQIEIVYALHPEDCHKETIEMNDRIRIAEAMGWGIGEDTCEGQEIGVPPDDTRPYGQGNLTVMPDPFTDANDDYAVLEWMREQNHLEFQDYYRELDGVSIFDYKIGDYARAALKVIE